MNCQDFEKLTLALARDGLLDATTREQGLIHVEDCERCAARLAEERALLTRVRAVVAEMSGEEPPARVETALLAAFRAQTAAAASSTVIPAPSRVRRWSSWKLAAVAAGILILISVTAIFWRYGSSHKPQSKELVKTPAPAVAPGPRITPLPTVEPQEDREPMMVSQSKKQRKRLRRRASSEDPTEAEMATLFILLREGEDLSALERFSLVRVELPGSAINEVGIPIVLELANTTVTADVLLGQDGLARAIRLVGSNSDTESIKRDYGAN